MSFSPICAERNHADKYLAEIVYDFQEGYHVLLACGIPHSFQ